MKIQFNHILNHILVMTFFILRAAFNMIIYSVIQYIVHTSIDLF